MDDFFNAAPENQAPVAEAPQVADPAADFLGEDVAAVADINEAPEELTVDSESPVDLAGEFESIPAAAEVMEEDAMRGMLSSGATDIPETRMDPSQLVNSMNAADERIAQLNSESESVRKWREDNEKRIVETDAKETSDLEEWKSTAKSQIEEFYKTYGAENEKRKNQNRISTASKPPSLDDPKIAWQQIGDFIDFNASRQAKETDKDRMKSLLFKLKTSPPVKAV
ncbi:unnamed protein product [Oikopleura dioica]|uniref:Clathrin light chain n=1 Tax=Oikopleura dioica TaxID=34765 RepID=E4XH09_OIKDI|nr:unnamed protein product [Oikopleura dioica]